MTQSQPKIPFHNLTFHDDLPKMRDVEARLKTFLETTRKRAQRVEIEVGRSTEEGRVFPYDLVDDADMGRIKRRAVWFLECKQLSTGMHHLSDENCVRLRARLMQTVLRERHGGPLVIIDEIDKSGEVQSNKSVRHRLTDALLPLLERITAATWQCPFFQVKFDMSWVNWVMTANIRKGSPDPLRSRCVVLDLP